jgi:hypothetical protein
MERLLDDAAANERSGTAFLMNSSLNSLLAEIDALEERLLELLASYEVQSAYQMSSPSRRAAVVHSLSWIGRHIKAALKGALRSLWNLISRLLTPKEWSVQGELGVGVAPFGLAKVSASITFGT